MRLVSVKQVGYFLDTYESLILNRTSEPGALPTSVERSSGQRLGSPSDSLRRARLSRPRDRMSSERRRAMDGPSARAVGQAGEPKAPDVSRANKWGRRPLVTLGLSKVTRPGPKGGRNPFEASGLASCMAKPCHPPITRNGRLRLTANRPYDANEMSHKDPSPALPFAGEGAKVSAPARSAAEHRPTFMPGSYQAKGGAWPPLSAQKRLPVLKHRLQPCLPHGCGHLAYRAIVMDGELL